MSLDNFLNNILHPSKIILNPKNKNHWLAMVRGYAINIYDWDRESAELCFTHKLMGDDFKDGLTPREAIDKIIDHLESEF